MRSEPTDLIQSVSRALRVLEQVTHADRPMPVKAIARRCGLNLSTTYHLMRTLCYEGYLTRQPDGSYAAGPQVAERFHDLMGHFQRPPSATAVLHHLAAACGYTAYLARVSAGRMVIVDVVEGPGSPWLEDLQVGLETAAHQTARSAGGRSASRRAASTCPPTCSPVCGSLPLTCPAERPGGVRGLVMRPVSNARDRASSQAAVCRGRHRGLRPPRRCHRPAGWLRPRRAAGRPGRRRRG